MSKPKITNNQDDNNEIKINVENKSSIAEFTKRPIPSDKELEDFEDYTSSSAPPLARSGATEDKPSDAKALEDKSSFASADAKALADKEATADKKEEAREEEIDESLSEIYREENGDMADVKKMDIKKKHGFLFWFFSIIFILVCLAGAGYGAHYFYMQSGSDSKAVGLAIEGKNKVMAGEEFFYIVNFKNLERVDINDIEIRLTLPENFIFLDSQPAAILRNDTWHFNSLPSHRSDMIKIKGKLIGKADQTAIILADMTYTPANFSSEFKKSASFESMIKDTGIELSFIHANSVMVGEESEIIVRYKADKENYLNKFRLTALTPHRRQGFGRTPPIALATERGQAGTSPSDAEEGSLLDINAGNKEEGYLKPGVWQINEVGEDEREIKIQFKINEKIADSQDMILRFEHSAGDDDAQYYLFAEEVIIMEVIKSDLNLNLIINGSQADQGIDFEQTLNYTVAYANKGETEMKDVIIMAVLESEFLDWQSLSDENNGKVEGDPALREGRGRLQTSISWSKEEILALEALEKGSEGAIDFSIKVAPLSEIDVSKDYQVKSYVQYSIGDLNETEEPSSASADAKALADKEATAGKEVREDMRSNTITNKINSDLRLDEQVRYFNDDNIAVGLGPHPPKSGEFTSYKVYWVLTNNLHELNNLQVQVDLPHYVKWGNKNRASVGNLQYDSESHKVTWQIGRLPATIYRADGEFNINITPEQDDKNKIMVLLPGTIIQAIDSETKAAINKAGKAKTTKLEDDEVVEGDGRVE
ncbi:hypothetical protein KAU19_04465 [Candidatus Parcubacteria bacterium]|nr:hypothetical protein [Candidatus Parcubacteria bacterium]